MHRPYWIPYQADPSDFPPLEQALDHPDGLLAIGGDLTPSRIMIAYRQGIFPWYSEDQPILWWSPSERMVLLPECLKISRSLKKAIRQNRFTLTCDQAFSQVVAACAGPRRHQRGTWITQEMFAAYCQLHQQGFAHSFESWYQDQLVGGLYGVVLGKVFFGESMFAHMTDASKVAFVYTVQHLQKWGYELIDCQVHTQHLHSFGAVEIPRHQYRALLDRLCEVEGYSGPWRFDSHE